MVPSGQLVGAPPPLHVIRQLWTPAQDTSQAPSHTTRHTGVESQVTLESGPTRALQLEACTQL